MPDHATWFSRVAGIDGPPHPWQAALADDPICRDRLMRLPAGLGTTTGAVLAWLWNRLVRPDPAQQRREAWPRRLVLCLPLRTLTEPAATAVRGWLDRAGLLWDGRAGRHAGRVGVHLLLGGADDGGWHLHPEHPAVLIGTQDLLLSRALNRGHGSPRARWPMEFGLLNQDSLWLLDGAPLMDVGLATSAQLQAFRQQDDDRSLRPCHSWWMGATLYPDALRSVDNGRLVEGLTIPPERILAIEPAQRLGHPWQATKRLRTVPAPDPAAIARLALAGHAALTDGPQGRITLVIVNTVERALILHGILAERVAAGTGLELLHCRFRGAERAAWHDRFLGRVHCRPGADRIIVATPVVEVGSDLSAGCLVTDLAPWAHLVQRFACAARWGGSAAISVALPRLADDDDTRPYPRSALVAARDLVLARLTDAAPGVLEDLSLALTPEECRALHPPPAAHLLLRQEWDELLDTTPDLCGADLDVSRFLHSDGDGDCLVFWAFWSGAVPPAELQPAQAALCPVPFLLVRTWLSEPGGGQAFVLDYLDGAWRPARSRDLFPGRVVLVDAGRGGYRCDHGFTGAKPGRKDPPLPPVPPALVSADQLGDAAQDREDLSAACYQTIATHGAAVGAWAARLGRELGLGGALLHLLDAAGRWHDAGKAHAAFRASIIARDAPARPDLAKAPAGCWAVPAALYDAGPGCGQRIGFRHELASALAAIELLARSHPEHPALRGGCADLAGPDPAVDPPLADHALADELAALAPPDFDLLLFLVAAHHGKVRTTLHAGPDDQVFPLAGRLGHPLRGICDDDVLPAFPLMGVQGRPVTLPALRLHLDCARIGLSPRCGRSWRERTLALQRRHGPAVLAWLEALMRTADIRASLEAQDDPLLVAGGGP